MRFPSGLVVLFGLFLLLVPYASGQERVQQIAITDWPLSVHEEASTDAFFEESGVLPLIDELTIAYSYRVADSLPAFSYKLQWEPGDFVYLDGKKTPFAELSGEVLIESIVVQAEVVVEDTPVTLFTLAHDSLMAQAMTGYVTVEMGDLAWETVFADTDAATAQAYFQKGFNIRNPKIASISFVHFEDDPAVAENEPATRKPRRPSRRTIFRPGISIWVDFPFYGRRPPPRIADVDTRSTEPRGDRVGRGDQRTEGARSSDDRRSRGEAEEETEDESTATGIFSGNKKKKDDDDDEEDEGDLLPAALAGVAAVAAVAVIGGTVGYYGNAEHAPIGLMTGYVHPKGGLLLQVAVNEAVLQKSKTETEYFMGRIVGFYDFFRSPVQPALGMGVLVNQRDNEVEYVPSFSPGLAGNFGSFVLMGGYDVLNGGLDFGVAYNFRARR
ncbi:MAG: hypothetical protein AAF564_14015 [Bacteroidota bacterium]